MTRQPKESNSTDEAAGEDILEFEGVPGDYPTRVVVASESTIGSVEHDERGQARWKFKVDSVPSADPTAETYNYLKALDAQLELEDGHTAPTLERLKLPGFDPYDTSAPVAKKK
jgi:hypothetical protein